MSRHTTFNSYAEKYTEIVYKLNYISLVLNYKTTKDT